MFNPVFIKLAKKKPYHWNGGLFWWVVQAKETQRHYPTRHQLMFSNTNSGTLQSVFVQGDCISFALSWSRANIISFPQHPHSVRPT
jgi:hypothetical protein